MEQLLCTKKAAAFLGVSAAFLERDRCYGPSIPFVRVGRRSIRYKLSDLEAYLEIRKVKVTRGASKPALALVGGQHG